MLKSIHNCIPMIMENANTNTYKWVSRLPGSWIFKNVMSKLFQDMEYAMNYLYDILVKANGRLKYHLLKLDIVLAKLLTTDMTVNSPNQSSLKKIEYLGWWITRQGIQLIRCKVEMNFILNIKAYKARKEHQLCKFNGIVNHYCNMWLRRSELLAMFHWLASHQTR
jgi:hypothetical protein